jgi:ribonuclease P protein component
MAAPPQAGPTRAPGGQAARADQAAPDAVGRQATRITTLKVRPEFLATRKGARWAGPLFVVEALKRPASPEPAAHDGPRFGFTVSKQNGNAVARNRIKRRLRAAVSQLQGHCARPHFDYVLIARRPALDAPFEALLADLAKGLERVSQERRPGQRSHPHRTKPPPSTSS